MGNIIPSSPVLNKGIQMEFTVEVDTSLDSEQIFVSTDVQHGRSYTIGVGQSLSDAIVSAVRNYIKFETGI